MRPGHCGRGRDRLKSELTALERRYGSAKEPGHLRSVIARISAISPSLSSTSQANTRTVSLSGPATALCDEAPRLRATMIVVGNRRVQRLTRVLGAVANDIARQAPCDVLVANTTLTSAG